MQDTVLLVDVFTCVFSHCSLANCLVTPTFDSTRKPLINILNSGLVPSHVNITTLFHLHSTLTIIPRLGIYPLQIVNALSFVILLCIHTLLNNCPSA